MRWSQAPTTEAPALAPGEVVGLLVRPALPTPVWSLDDFTVLPSVQRAAVPLNVRLDVADGGWVSPAPYGEAGGNWEAARWLATPRYAPPGTAAPVPPRSPRTLGAIYTLVTGQPPPDPGSAAFEQFAQSGIEALYDAVTARYAQRVSAPALRAAWMRASQRAAAGACALAVSAQVRDPVAYLRGVLCGVLETARVRLLEVSRGDAAFMQWYNSSPTAARLRQDDALSTRVYVLCGAVPRDIAAAETTTPESLTTQLVLGRDTARALLTPVEDDPASVQMGRRKYIAVATGTPEQPLLGLLLTRDFRRLPSYWREHVDVAPQYFRLEVRPEALREQNIGAFPPFDPVRDAVLGVQTRLVDDQGAPNRLANSLEMEFLCARTVAMYAYEPDVYVEVEVLARWVDPDTRLGRVRIRLPAGLETADRERVVDESETRYEAGTGRPAVGYLLMVHALLADIGSDYTGTMSFVVNTLDDTTALDVGQFRTARGVTYRTLQGGYMVAVNPASGEPLPGAEPQPLDPSLVGTEARTNVDVAATYHRWLQYERTFPTPDEGAASEPKPGIGSLWFYDGGNLYAIRRIAAAPGVPRIAWRSPDGREYRPRDLLPSQGLMFRPYPTVAQLASYVALGASLVSTG